MQRVWRDSGAL